MALSKAAVPALVIRQEPDPEPAASNVVVIVKAKASLPLPQPVNGPGHQTGGYLHGHPERYGAPRAPERRG